MTGRRKIGLFLVVAGVALLAASGIMLRKGSPAMAKIAADNATFEDSLKRVHAQLVATSLKARGLQESESQIPDTLKVYGAGKMMELQNSYNKTIRKLEMTERDINLEIASLKRDAEREKAAGKARTLPVAGGGAAVLLLGIILSALPNRRVGA